MAKLDDPIAHVADSNLRGQLQQAAVELRRRKNFGLVYEEHIPETALLPATGIRKGAVVLVRTEPNSETRYVVDALTETEAAINDRGEVRTVPICDLLVVKPFGEPVYPMLRLRDAVVRSEDKPTLHTDAAVICAGTVGIHVLAYLPRALTESVCAVRSLSSRMGRLRLAVVVAILLAGIALSVVTYANGTWPARNDHRPFGGVPQTQGP
jgi:hypothetical protein